MKITPNTLYIVATPIGNLDDITHRAIEVLNGVDKIAAEDTRHSGKLLKSLQITTPCIALHEHNEREQADKLLERVANGASIALISDAGTPLVSDPGYYLVKRAHELGITVSPIPGASAAITALCAAGLASDRFCFEGFLTAKSQARINQLEKLKDESRTLIFYEAPHRIEGTLKDMAQVFGEQRRATLARELTKTFETIKQDSLLALANWVSLDSNQQRGEIVLVVAGKPAPEEGELPLEAKQIVETLVDELPLKQAVGLAMKLTGLKKKPLYNYGLSLKERE